MDEGSRGYAGLATGRGRSRDINRDASHGKSSVRGVRRIQAMMRTYRPWGLLKWVLEKTPKVKWSVFGCVGPEERSLAAIEHINEAGLVADSRFLRIEDPPSRYSLAIRSKITLREKQFMAAVGGFGSVRHHSLLES